MEKLSFTTSQKLTLVSVLSVNVLTLINQTMINTALPSIMAEMNISSTLGQYLVSCYALTQAMVIPLVAFLMGKFKTRQLFFAAGSFLLAGSLLMSLATMFPLLIMGRMMQAICMGIMAPMTTTITLLMFPASRRGLAMGIISFCMCFSPIIGPPISGFIIDAISWRAVWIMVAIVISLLLVFGFFALKNQGPFEESSFDLLSVALCCLGFFSLLFAISSWSTLGSPVILATIFTMGALFIFLFVKRQKNFDPPLLRLETLKQRRFRLGCITTCLAHVIIMGNSVFIAIFVQQVMGLPATINGLVVVPGAIAMVPMGLISGHMFDKYGVKIVARVGVSIFTAGVIGLLFVTPEYGVFGLAACNVLISIGSQVTTQPMNTWGINSLELNEMQHGNSINSFSHQLGNGMGTSFLVSLTALAPFFFPELTGSALTYSGVHIAYIGMTVVAVTLLVLLYARGHDLPTDIKNRR